MFDLSKQIDSPDATENNAEIEPIKSIDEVQESKENVSINPCAKHIPEDGKEEIVVLRTPIIKLTRRQIYDEIWEISVADIYFKSWLKAMPNKLLHCKQRRFERHE